MATPMRMPAAFLGHGSPMNALEANRYSAAWRAFGASVPRPRAILMVSAHWYVNASAVTAMARPRTIHDFHGFPQALFDIEYTALKMLIEAEERMRTQGVTLWLASLNPQVLHVVQQSPLAERLGRTWMFFNLQTAVGHYEQLQTASPVAGAT